jgi:hypothetical protein
MMDGARDKGPDGGEAMAPKEPVPPKPVRNTGALGMPSGSIRALLTLMTVAFITIQTARGERVSLLWFESLMIVLAHYFASRRLVQLSPELRARLTKEGVLEAEPNPLYLPRYSLRLLIVGAFAALAAYLWRNGRLLDPVALPVFIAVGSYFLGIAFHSVSARWRRYRGTVKAHGASRFDDIRAAVTLAIMGLVIVLHLFGWQAYVPHADKLEALPLALMLFYFGSR